MSDASERCIRRSTTTESKEQSCPTSIVQEGAYLLRGTWREELLYLMEWSTC